MLGLLSSHYTVTGPAQWAAVTLMVIVGVYSMVFSPVLLLDAGVV